MRCYGWYRKRFLESLGGKQASVDDELEKARVDWPLRMRALRCSEILGNSSKKITGHKTPNFENFRKFFHKNAIKHDIP